MQLFLSLEHLETTVKLLISLISKLLCLGIGRAQGEGKTGEQPIGGASQNTHIYQLSYTGMVHGSQTTIILTSRVTDHRSPYSKYNNEKCWNIAIITETDMGTRSEQMSEANALSRLAWCWGCRRPSVGKKTQSLQALKEQSTTKRVCLYAKSLYLPPNFIYNLSCSLKSFKKMKEEEEEKCKTREGERREQIRREQVSTDTKGQEARVKKRPLTYQH